ncbi:hypothetical protein ACFC8F_32700 [Streptomyces hydrogenans]|uniref:hypothetical protein n=1 Tax=Streptomyces hydrogenans TaxID=1873719 RepID=UPI0035DE7D73
MLAAAFTGDYKHCERSGFLLQTAEAIEQEANAFALGVGPYSDFDTDQEQQALKLFTQTNRRTLQRAAAPPATTGPARRPDSADRPVSGLSGYRSSVAGHSQG